MDSDEFFEKQTGQSEIKSKIVANYFIIWVKVMAQVKTNTKIGYIDLFSGPGIYRDGSDSTPLIILKKVVADPVIADKLQCYFNDINKGNIEKLKKTVSSTIDICKLKYRPIFTSS